MWTRAYCMYDEERSYEDALLSFLTGDRRSIPLGPESVVPECL